MNNYIAETTCFKYAKPIFICLLLCWLIVPVFVLIYYVLLAKSEKIVFNDVSYTIQRGVFKKTITNREITKILSVTNEQSMFGKTFNYGNIFCQTPEGFGSSFDHVKNPKGLQDYLEGIHNRNKVASTELI